MLHNYRMNHKNFSDIKYSETLVFLQKFFSGAIDESKSQESFKL